MRFWTMALAGAMALSTMDGSWAATLITDSEAALPAAAAGMTLRGITRGPGISLISPAQVAAPFNLKVKFTAHGGAAIDPASLKVVYLKSPLVDVTERVMPFASAAGIDMAEAEVPPGRHHLRIEIKDKDGRTGALTVELNAVK